MTVITKRTIMWECDMCNERYIFEDTLRNENNLPDGWIEFYGQIKVQKDIYTMRMNSDMEVDCDVNSDDMTVRYFCSFECFEKFLNETLERRHKHFPDFADWKIEINFKSFKRRVKKS